MRSDLVYAFIRTAVPYAIAAVLSFVAIHFGVVLSPDIAAQVVPFVVAVVGTAYYQGVRFLERKFPALGWLLGVPAQPVYPELPADVR